MNQPVDLPLPVGHYATLPNGLRLHYLDEGAGPVVLWLHGSGPGASGFSNFKGNYPQLVAAGYRNIVLDLPGFGRSDKPEDVQYNLDFFVDCVAAFLESVGVRRCTLLGNSLGGAIALGHPLGCTGAKLSIQIIHDLKRTGGKYGLVTACVGGGQGIAGIIESL